MKKDRSQRWCKLVAAVVTWAGKTSPYISVMEHFIHNIEIYNKPLKRCLDWCAQPSGKPLNKENFEAISLPISAFHFLNVKRCQYLACYVFWIYIFVRGFKEHSLAQIFAWVGVEIVPKQPVLLQLGWRNRGSLARLVSKSIALLYWPISWETLS